MSGPGNPYDAWADLMMLWEPFADDSDVKFYARVAAEHGGPAVELGIGYARVAEHVRPDFGVDSSAVMLELASARVPETQLIDSDLSSYVLPRPVRFAYAPLNTFDSVTDDDAVAAALRCTWEQTEPGGRLVFDGLVPDLPRILADNRRVELGCIDERIAIYTIEQVVDRTTGELRVVAIAEELGEDGVMRSRRYFPPQPIRRRTPAEWASLLTATGWEVVESWGGFEGEPLEDDGWQQVWVAQRPDDGAR